MLFIIEAGGVVVEVGVPLHIATGGGGGGGGEPGASAYELAVAAGFAGTVEQWLASLVGGAGDDGASAYELAVAAGFVGTVEQWLASLQGVSHTLQVVSSQAAFDAAVSSPTHWVVRY